MKEITFRDRAETPSGRCRVCLQSCFGYVKTVNGQDTVRCMKCNKYLYNAPKEETGREVRSTTTNRKGIKPKRRSKLIDRAGGRCERCGKPADLSKTGLHIGHVVSVHDGERYGLTREEINADENLIVECDECNLAHGSSPVPLRIYVAILRNRLEAISDG